MAKTARTYRLTYEALEAIENRDRSKYPTANEYVESKILEAGREKEETDFLYRLSKMEGNLEAVLQILRQHFGMEKAAEGPPLPDGFSEKNNWRI